MASLLLRHNLRPKISPFASRLFATAGPHGPFFDHLDDEERRRRCPFGWAGMETKDSVKFRLDMASVGKDGVELVVKGDEVLIKGVPKKDPDTDAFVVIGGKPVSTREQKWVFCNSTFNLPAKYFKLDEIKAVIKHGVLKVTIPKKVSHNLFGGGALTVEVDD